MKHYILLMTALILFFLACFGAVEAMQWELLTDPAPWMQGNLFLAGLLGVSLLVADIFIPVPATIVMITHGALFGVIMGTVVSLVGCLLSAWLGFCLGRRGAPLLSKWVPEAERKRANELLERWGMLAVIVSRPVPLLSESVAIVAGTGRLGWTQFSFATLGGALPAAFLYAYTGATAANLGNMALIFGLVLIIAALFWVVGRHLQST